MIIITSHIQTDYETFARKDADCRLAGEKCLSFGALGLGCGLASRQPQTVFTLDEVLTYGPDDADTVMAYARELEDWGYVTISEDVGA